MKSGRESCKIEKIDYFCLQLTIIIPQNSIKMAYHHLGLLVHEQAKKYQNKTAFKFPDESGRWSNISWTEFSQKVMMAARAMSEIGIKPGDNIGIYSQNMPQYLYTDFGAYANRAVMVPLYATSSPSQVEYIVNDAKLKYIFVGEQFQYNNGYLVQKESNVLEKMIIFDRKVVIKSDDTTSIYFDDFIVSGENSNAIAVVNVRLKQLRDTDLATIIYTSGTTGESKGVMLTHSNYLSAMKIHDIRLTRCSDKDVSMCFLPLTHIFEKAWTYYCIHKGMTVAINQDPTKIQDMLKQVHPTIMSSVPRFWEKVYAGIKEKIDSAEGLMKWLFNDAYKTGHKHNLEYKNEGKKPPFGNSLKYHIYKKTVYSIVKKAVGIDKGNFFPCAGAPLSNNINEFLQSIDIHIMYGYGLTETTATVSCFPYYGFRLGSVGKVMPEVDVKIGEGNEILVKGGTVTKGYYNKPEETAKVFTEDGFFRTGDAGYLNEGNTLVMTERIKDLFKTSNGKYIAPQMIEMALSEDKYIDQLAVIADQRKFASALIVPDYKALEQYAKDNNISFSSREELISNPEINSFLYGRIELRQASFSSYEKIKRFALLPNPFTIDSGELTNTLKLKRKVVAEKYADIIDKMYEE